jgi:hypothetical protein
MERALLAVSLFAANGVDGNELAYCMFDVTENGTPCTSTSPDIVVYDSADITSVRRTAMFLLWKGA